ncbi:MAG: FAD-dependent oxidoreductase [Thermoanaerobaculia bacterium]
MPPEIARTPDRSPRIAIVGAGPAGFYTAAALLAQTAVDGPRIDLLDRLPTPYGLVRYGVAPDHPKIKEVVRVFEKVALDARVRFLGNLEVGRDLSLADLAAHYDQVVFSVGGQSDRRLGVPGEDLPGSHSSTALVAWYSSHPDFRELPVDLSVAAAAVIGAGNVAVDVARILGRNPEDLAATDISDDALARLRASRIRDVHFIVRRGPVQAKWSPAELKELAHLPGVDLVVDRQDLELDPGSELELADDPQAQKSLEILRAAAERGLTGAARRIHLHFRRSPVAIEGESEGEGGAGSGRVAGLRLERNRLVGAAGSLSAKGTGEVSSLPVGLVVRAVGYRSLPLRDLPFDVQRAVIPNQRGRIFDAFDGSPLASLYVAGWIKRGPTGLIGTNKPDGYETAEAMLEDLPSLPRAAGAPIDELLAARGLCPVDFADWKRLDRIEVERGLPAGRPRVKFSRVEEMLAALAAEPVS